MKAYEPTQDDLRRAVEHRIREYGIATTSQIVAGTKEARVNAELSYHYAITAVSDLCDAVREDEAKRHREPSA
jgi:hypothetical protein